MSALQHVMICFLAAATASGCGPRAVTLDEPGQEPVLVAEGTNTPIPSEVGNIPRNEMPPAVGGEGAGRRPMRQLLATASGSILHPDHDMTEEEIANLSTEDRQLLETMQTWFADVGENLGNGDDPWMVMAAASDSLQKQLNRKPELKLPSVALCTRVGGFGDYDEWGNRTGNETYTFIAHAGQPVIIYAEMDGVSSRLDDRSLWETITSQHLVIYSDRDGMPLWEEQWQTASDRSRVRRKNYFTTQVVELPPALSAGNYHLRLRVRDEKSGAEAERSIQFTMSSARRK
ncbi:MAG: hypothetical protein VX908_00520 [Planctomycetota bacterium]|nr:hypothetical protein [Planctomycetota bacterium]